MSRKPEACAIGVDLGGTFIKAGAVSAAGEILYQESRPTEVDKGCDAIIANIAGAAEAAREGAGLSWDRIKAVGLGAPGVFDYDRGGLVHIVPNLPPLVEQPLITLVERKLNRPGIFVLLENDANAAAFGEMWAGAGREVRTLALFTLGTGVGGGIVLDGEVWHGATGFAGELGHQTILPDGPVCGCGNRGCLEVLASATGIVRRFREAVEAGRGEQKSSLAGQVRAGDELTARDIDAAAKAGDATAREVMEETGRYLGIAAANMINILNPEMIVFGGGVTAAGDILLDPIREEAKKRAIDVACESCPIVFATLGNDAGLIGAAGCALKASEISASLPTSITASPRWPTA